MAEIPISSNLDFGFGLDSPTGVAKANAIDFDEPTIISPGQNTIVKIDIIKQTSELTSLLDIEARFSIDGLSQGGSAEASMSKFIEVNEYYTYGLLRSIVTNPRRLIQNPRLKQEASDILQQQGYEAFVRQYGDQFIEGIIPGGSYYAMIVAETKSIREQESARAALSYSFGAGGLSGEARTEFRQRITQLRDSIVLTIYTRQSGGAGDPSELDLDEMLDQVQSFPGIVNNDPVPMRAIVSNYQDRIVMPQPEPRDSLAKRNQRDVLNELGTSYIKLRDYKSSLELVVQNIADFDQFRDLDEAGLEAKRVAFRDDLQLVIEDIDTIARSARKCAEDLGNCLNFSPRAKFLRLPTIGGESLTIRQIQDQLLALRQQYEEFQTRLSSTEAIALDGRDRANGAQNAANDAIARANTVESIANDAVNKAGASQSTANEALNKANEVNLVGKRIKLKEGERSYVREYSESEGGGRGVPTVTTTYLITRRGITSNPDDFQSFTIELA